MRNFITLILGLILSGTVHAQTFTDSPGTTLPELVVDCSTTITVNGVGIINTDYGLQSVCIDITHEYVGDLEEITLVAPDGTQVLLSSNNGGSGDNYSVTCFEYYATTHINDGTPPYNGTFEPQGDLSTFNTNGINADGVWQLCIHDDYQGDSAPIINTWSITFSDTPASPPSCTDGIMNQDETGIDCGGVCPECDYSLDLGADTAVCTGGSVLLEVSPNFLDYLWGDGSTGNTYIASTAGEHIVQVWYRGENSVVNGDFEAGDNGFTTQYTVGTGGTWGPVSNEGTYLVTTDPNIAHINFPSCTDHTADPGNQMMVVNGSGTDNQSIWCQTITVNPNTDYEFSTWIQNYDYGNPAELAFFINGSQLGNTITPTSANCDWQNFFEMWNSGSETSIEICIVNENTAGSGNDFAIDDISFNEIVMVSDTIELSIIELTSDITVTDVSCNGNDDGTAEVELQTTGVAYYTYEWSNSTTNGPTANTTDQITGLAPGNYDVTVTDAIGCEVVQAFTIGEPTALSLDLSVTNAACGPNGAIQVNISNGTAPFEIEWSPGNTFSTPNLPYIIANLPPQTYSLTITDGNGCEISGSATVEDLGNVIAVITPIDDQCLEGNSFNFDASTSTITSTSTYAWDYGDGNSGTGVSNAHTYASEGNYTVTLSITDGTCSDTETVDISVFGSPSVNIIPTHVSCNGAADGSVGISINEGTAPLQNINWLPAGYTGANSTNYTNLDGGTYTVTFEDANGCPSNAEATVIEAGPMILELSSTNAGCNSACDGTATAEITSGGTPPFNYNWGAGSHPSNSATTTELCGSTPTSDSQTYIVTVTDANNCEIQGQVTISGTTTIEPSIDLIEEPSCYSYNDGNIYSSAIGGNPPYTFLWSNGSSEQNLIGTTAGEYSLSVTDISGCVVSIENIILNQPNEPIFALEYDALICKGQSSEAVMSVTSSPYSPYSYYWNGIESTNSIILSPQETTTYHAQIIDANGCESIIQEFEIEVNPALSVITTPDQTTICKGDLVTVGIESSGGNGNYMLSLIDGTPISAPYTFSPNTNTEVAIILQDDCGTIPDTSIFQIEVKQAIVPSFHANQRYGCVPLEIEFIQDIASHEEGTEYVWNFYNNGTVQNTALSPSPSHTFDNSGRHHVSLQITSPFGCISEHIEYEYIHAYPRAEAAFTSNNDGTSIINPNVYFENLSEASDRAYWYFGDGDSSSSWHASHTYSTIPMDYYCTLIASNRFGCTDSSVQKVRIFDESVIHVPTAFTPDFDGKNEIFKVLSNGILESPFEMIIYDRWGEEIFKSKNFSEGWNGKVKGGLYAKPGMYPYIIKYYDSNHTPHEHSGFVNVIR